MLERLGEHREIRRLPDPIALPIFGQPGGRSEVVHDLRRDVEGAFLDGGETDADPRMGNPVQVGGHRGAVLVRLTENEIRPPLLERLSEARQHRAGVEAGEDLADDEDVGLLE